MERHATKRILKAMPPDYDGGQACWHKDQL